MKIKLIKEKSEPPKKSMAFRAGSLKDRQKAYRLLNRCEVGQHVLFDGDDVDRNRINAFCRSCKIDEGKQFAVSVIGVGMVGAWRVA